MMIGLVDFLFIAPSVFCAYEVQYRRIARYGFAVLVIRENSCIF